MKTAARSPVIGIPVGDLVEVDLGAVRRSCEDAIAYRPGDASIPRVVISADILLAIVSHAERVRRAVLDALVDRGPIVEGPGAADAAGEVAVDYRLIRSDRHWMAHSSEPGTTGECGSDRIGTAGVKLMIAGLSATRPYDGRRVRIQERRAGWSFAGVSGICTRISEDGRYMTIVVVEDPDGHWLVGAEVLVELDAESAPIFYDR